MSVKFYENALNALKKANKARKMVLAGRAGYDTVEEYQKFLESMSIPYNSGMTQSPHIDMRHRGPGTVDKVKKVTKKPVVYVADVIDCSLSMSGGKLLNAILGINKGIEKMKDETKVSYKHLLCDFSGRGDINFSEVTDINNVGMVSFYARGNTALHDATIETINKLVLLMKSGEKGLINIYTDGQNNESTYSANDVNFAIKKAAAIGITVTFVGTERDTDSAIRNFGLHASNTAVYDGTAFGLEQTMSLMSDARSNYAKNVSIGKDVSKGFFKEIKNK